eukprot:5744656-Pyramimonas_sp.AAC.1
MSLATSIANAGGYCALALWPCAPLIHVLVADPHPLSEPDSADAREVCRTRRRSLELLDSLMKASATVRDTRKRPVARPSSCDVKRVTGYTSRAAHQTVSSRWTVPARRARPCCRREGTGMTSAVAAPKHTSNHNREVDEFGSAGVDAQGKAATY